MVAGTCVRAWGSGEGFLEPAMPVRGVVRNDVQDQAQAVLVRLRDQGLGIVEGAEQRIELPIVADVIARVDLGRGVPGIQPKRVDAQRGQIRQAA